MGQVLIQNVHRNALRMNTYHLLEGYCERVGTTVWRAEAKTSPLYNLLEEIVIDK